MKKLFFLFTMLTVFALSSVAATWTVAGSSNALFGNTWDPSNTNNDMTLEDGLYTWTKSNVSLDADFQFKICKDHAWTESYGKDGGSANFVQSVSENAAYDVKITFNEGSKAIACTLTKVGAGEEVEHTYTVAGSPAALFGTEWAPTSTDNDMTLADGVYTWSKSDVELSASTTIEFKCVRDHAWGVEYPASNYTTTVADAGTYDVVITLDATTFAVNCTVTAKSVTPAEPWATIYIDQTSASGNFYAWDSTGNYGSWPGNAISSLGTAEKDGTTYYVFNFTHSGADTPKVIFNNNDGQTEDISVADGDVLKYNGGTAYEFVTDEPVVVEPYATIYIDNINSTDGYLHAWDSAGDYTTWPGVQLSDLPTGEKDGNTYYKYEFTHDGGTSPSILFHDKDTQTANIAVADGDVLKYLGGDSYVHNGVTYPIVAEPAYYLRGDVNNWNQSEEDEVLQFTENEGVFTLTKTFSGAFKIVDQDGNWYGGEAEGETNHWLTAENPSVELINGNNLYLDEEAEYTLTIEDGVLTVAGFTEPDPVTVSSIALYGSSNEWAEPIATFTDNEKGGFVVADLAVAANDAFNIVVNYSDESQTWLIPQTEDNFLVTEDLLDTPLTLAKANMKNFYFDAAGTFTFTVDAEATQLTISGEFEAEPVTEPVFQLKGKFDLATETYVDMTKDAEADVWTATVKATGGATFKFYDSANDATYGGLTGDATYGVHAGWHEGIPTATDGNAEFELKMLEAAELTITLTKGEQGYSFSVDGIPAPEDGYYLVGSFNGWQPVTGAVMFVENTATQALEAEAQFKVVEISNYEATWYGGDTQGQGDTFELKSDFPSASLTAGDGGANFIINTAGEYTFTIENGVLTVSGWAEPQPAFYLVGDFNNWNLNPEDEVIEFTENEGVWTATATLWEGAKFKVKDQDGTWYGGDTQGESEWYELKATWPSAPLTAGDAGSNFIINTDGEYTFTIENGVLTVSGWDGCTLAEALAGNNAPISDELTVVRVKNGSAYVTDGNDNWLRVEAGNVSDMTPGCVINGYQLSGITTPAINPTVTFDGDLEFTDGENVPALDEIDLQAGITEMPKPAEVVKITGYYRIEGGEAVLSAYAGNVKGNTIAVADANGSMTEGVQYTVEVAVALKEAWEAEGGTVTDVDTNLGDDTITIGGGGGSTVNPRAPRKVKASDKDALKNITLSLVGDPVATGVSDIAVDADVVSVKYVNVAGQVSAQPFDGINVVVTTYVDGTTKAVKVVK